MLADHSRNRVVVLTILPSRQYQAQHLLGRRTFRSILMARDVTSRIFHSQHGAVKWCLSPASVEGEILQAA